MTLALAVVFVALLMIYCGVKGRSFKHALIGKSVLGGDGSIIADAAGATAGQSSSTGNAGASSTSQPGTSGQSRGEGGPHR